MERIAGNITFTKRARNLSYFFCCLIAEAALPIAERPEWGQRWVSCQVRITRQDIPRRWTAKDVVDEVSVAGAKPGPLRIIMGKVKLDTCRAIKKEAPGLTILQHQCERDRDIEIILQRCVTTRRINIPKNLLRPRLVQFTCALPAPKIVLTSHMLLIHSDRHSQRSRLIGQIDNRSFSRRREPAHTKLWIIQSECTSHVIGKTNAQGIKREMSSRSRGCKRHFIGFLNNGYWPRLPILRNNSHRTVIHRAALREKTNAKQIRSKRGHFDGS